MLTQKGVVFLRQKKEDELHRIETDVEDFLPDYYLSGDEEGHPGDVVVSSLWIVACMAAVCGLSFFVWSMIITGNTVVVAGGNGHGKESQTVPERLLRPGTVNSTSSLAEKASQFDKMFRQEVKNATYSNN